MFRHINEINSPDVFSGSSGFKNSIKCAFGVPVQIVYHHDNPLTGIFRIKQPGSHLSNPDRLHLPSIFL